MTLFQMWLVSCVICIPYMIALNKIHDGFVTMSDLTADVIWGLVPAWNIIFAFVMTFLLARKFRMLDWLLVRQNRLIDWWDKVSNKKVF